MKILIIGASGMVGHVLMNKFHASQFAVIGIARRKTHSNIVQIDLTNWSAFKTFLSNSKFDLIVNCSGILVKESSANKLYAVYLNSMLPHLLIDFFKNSSTKVIHLSTGGVFSGNDECYYEDATVSPLTYYGVTKAAGEFTNDKDLVIRSDFWGPDSRNDGTGIFNWFLHEQKEVSAYNKVYFNGISNVEFSRIFLELVDCVGLINIGGELISKGEFLNKIKQIFKLKHIFFVDNNEICKKIYLKNHTRLPEINDYDTMIWDVYHYMNNGRRFYRDVYPFIFD